MSPSQIATRMKQVRAEWTADARAQRARSGLRRRTLFLKWIEAFEPSEPCRAESRPRVLLQEYA